MTWAVRLGSALIAAACMAVGIQHASAETRPTLGVDGTELVLTLEGGRVLRSADLVGAVLNVELAGREDEITIGSVEEDRAGLCWIIGRIQFTGQP